MFDLTRRLVAEALGTGLLVATVIGSAIMADRLTDDTALTLLCNTLPTGAILVVLITTLAPVSGAHFNPVVSLIAALRRDLYRREAIAYVFAQIAGGIAGTMIAHAMFGVEPLQLSTNIRTGNGQWLAEAIATFGLIATILGSAAFSKRDTPWLVGLYITAAYWFTASTSFANPAVTIARAFTDSFAGIRPLDAPAFVLAQIVGAFAALAVMTWLLKPLEEKRI